MKLINKIVATIIVLAMITTSVQMTFAEESDCIATSGDIDIAISNENVMPNAEAAIEVPAKSYALIEASTGRILAENNSHEKMAPASITKIMTMLLLMEKIEAGEVSFDDKVVTSEHAHSMGGTQIWLEIGETMSIHDLLRATAVNSANDASVAIAEHVAGSEESFAGLMNQKAEALGMKDTTFKNATGLDAEGHLSSAYDVALMSAELFKYEKIKEYTSIWMDSLRDGTTELVNTNKMVRYYPGCNGIKTGTTDDAGSCLSVSATREDMTLIAVSMGSTTSNERFESGRKLLDYGFSSYAVVTPNIDDIEIPQTKIMGGQKQTIETQIEGVGSVVVKKSSKDKIEKKVVVDQELKAPIEQGQKIGVIIFELDGATVAELPITSKEKIEEINFGFAFKLLAKFLIGGNNNNH